jgi:hypothetical protein
MTRILLHPRMLPRYSGTRVQLGPPWQWWRCRCYPDANGNAFYQQYDDPRNINEASLLFNVDIAREDADIVDPPAMHMIVHQPEWHDIMFGGSPVTRLMDRGMSAECDVVWYGQPGPRWLQMPGNTCRVGDYQVAHVDRHHRPPDLGTDRAGALGDPERVHWDSMMGVLRNWAPGAMTHAADYGLAGRLGAATVAMTQREAQRYEETRRLNREEVAAVYGVPPTGVAEVLTWGGDVLGYRPTTPRAPNVLPEQDVVDEIDRLVNEQVRPGPRDDYGVNRYPKCKDCGHDWHGLDCGNDLCDCVNTEWLKK